MCKGALRKMSAFNRLLYVVNHLLKCLAITVGVCYNECINKSLESFL